MPTPISGPYIARSVSISGQSGLLTFLGLTSTNRSKTVRDATDTLLELGGSYIPTGTYTNLTLITPILGTPASGVMTNVTGTADGLTAGDVTRNHPIYAAASPPTVDVGPFAIIKTGVDLKTNATTDIFTIPASRAFVCTNANIIPTAITAGAAVAIVWRILESGASGVMTTNTAATNTAPSITKVWAQIGAGTASTSPNNICAAGNKVQLSITTGWTTSTTVTGNVIVFGYYSA